MYEPALNGNRPISAAAFVASAEPSVANSTRIAPLPSVFGNHVVPVRESKHRSTAAHRAQTRLASSGHGVPVGQRDGVAPSHARRLAIGASVAARGSPLADRLPPTS